jgi:hypothetical protein
MFLKLLRAFRPIFRVYYQYVIRPFPYLYLPIPLPLSTHSPTFIYPFPYLYLPIPLPIFISSITLFIFMVVLLGVHH